MTPPMTSMSLMPDNISTTVPASRGMAMCMPLRMTSNKRQAAQLSAIATTATNAGISGPGATSREMTVRPKNQISWDRGVLVNNSSVGIDSPHSSTARSSRMANQRSSRVRLPVNSRMNTIAIGREQQASNDSSCMKRRMWLSSMA